MMPPPRNDVGERISSLEATVGALEKYTHEKWHDLANVLQPLSMLPERMTRENGKLHGVVEGRINSMSKEIERSLGAAIKDAMAPLADDVREVKSKLEEHETEIDELKAKQDRWTGARLVAAWIIGTIVSIIGALLGTTFRASH